MYRVEIRNLVETEVTKHYFNIINQNIHKAGWSMLGFDKDLDAESEDLENNNL